jgi:hypothetical protein
MRWLPFGTSTALLVLLLSWPRFVHGQAPQFGTPARSVAASQALILAVQQGISSLPPTSGLSFIYEFDPSLGVPVRSEQPGPISLRAPETVKDGAIAIRAATSYFAISTLLEPLVYRTHTHTPSVMPPLTVPVPVGHVPKLLELGLDIGANVAITNLTLQYGVLPNTEVSLNLPLVRVTTHVDELYAFGDELSSLQHATLNRAGLTPPLFNPGAHVGVGRITLGTKARIYSDPWFRLALACDGELPSPNEHEFAGSKSGAISPRIIGSLKLADWMTARADTGYEYDFSISELRRFVWNAGVSLSRHMVDVDLGIGGSRYESPIEWTPRQIGELFEVSRRNLVHTTATTIANNETDTTFVDFLAGVKVRLKDNMALSGAVTVPVLDANVQPIVTGTIAFEAFF